MILRKEIQERVWQIIKPLLYYGVWSVVSHLFFLSIITYVLVGSDAKFGDISDFYAANEVVVRGLSAGSYLLFLVGFQPLTGISIYQLISFEKIKNRFLPGLLHGFILSAGLLAAFLLSGHTQYLGIYLQLEDAGLWLIQWTLRITAILGLAFAEEFVFRVQVFRALQKLLSPWQVVLASALFYVGFKAIQFDLTWMQWLSLSLFGVYAGFRTLIDGDSGRAAGFWFGVLFFIHPLFSLPIFGSEFQGLLLMKQTQSTEEHYFLTGGAIGPLASIGFQFLVLTDILQLIVRNRKYLFHVSKTKLTD